MADKSLTARGMMSSVRAMAQEAPANSKLIVTIPAKAHIVEVVESPRWLFGVMSVEWKLAIGMTAVVDDIENARRDDHDV